MQYFNFLNDEERQRLFAYPPSSFTRFSPLNILRSSVGALLYVPGTNQRIADIILSRKIPSLSSLAVCLEDTVGDSEIETAIKNVFRQLSLLADDRDSVDNLPLVFIRVRDAGMLSQLADKLADYSGVLAGVILPKVNMQTLENALVTVREIGARSNAPFYAMPILESVALMETRDRIAILNEMKDCISRFSDCILNIRVGATDLCGLYGIRRGVNTPLYHISAVSACIGDIVRVFGLRDQYTISGSVWEYYNPLPESAEMQGLLKEVKLDLQNGLCGKTCIHPTQLLPVQASYAVSWEEYTDASAILGGDRDHTGVLPSVGRNKMNELKPHSIWSGKIMRRALVYGVYREGVGVNELMKAGGLWKK